MEEPKCKECKFFHQHYVTFGDRYVPAGCGHCVYPRLKHRPPNTLACVYFARREELK